MIPDWTLVWPGEWTTPNALARVAAGPIRRLLFEDNAGSAEIAAAARERGFEVCQAPKFPTNVEIVSGEIPGIRMGNAQDEASAGPTGAPWVDSNGFRIRMARLRKPAGEFWVRAKQPKAGEVFPPERHLLAIADAAAYGGRWVVSLDSHLAQGIADGNADAVKAWERIGKTIGFFRKHGEWESWQPQALLGVVSDFAGPNEFLSSEILNLAARQHATYKLFLKSEVRPGALGGLRAVVYVDAEAPAAPLRAELMKFVETGGLLIAGPAWGAQDGVPAAGQEHLRYAWRSVGKGRIAVAKEELQDPFVVASDLPVLMSRRNDVLRLWNAGILGSYYAAAPDGNRAVVHVMNYAGSPLNEAVTLWVAARYRTARLWELEATEPKPLPVVALRQGVEMHLPPVGVYAAVELDK